MDNSKERIIELLAPAGSWEALEAAVNAGASNSIILSLELSIFTPSLPR